MNAFSSQVSQFNGKNPLIDLTIFKEMEIRYKNSPELEQIDSPSRVSDLAQILIGDCSEIRFLVFYINRDFLVFGYSVVAQGAVDEAVVYPREIFKGAILCNASAIVSCRNRPDGEVVPREEDVLITRRIDEVGAVVGIELVDHLIVGGEGVFSLREWGAI